MGILDNYSLKLTCSWSIAFVTLVADCNLLIEVVELCLNLEKLRLEVAKRAWRKKLVGLDVASEDIDGGGGVDPSLWCCCFNSLSSLMEWASSWSGTMVSWYSLWCYKKVWKFWILHVYTETLNSRNLKVENPFQNDVLGFVNDKIMLRQIEEKNQNINFTVIFT